MIIYMLQKIQIRNFTLGLRTLRKITANDLKTKTNSSSSNNWLSRQLSDPYIEKAKTMNYRCRSAFKLIEVDDRYKFLHPGDIVIDCGAAPGSWSQVAVKLVNSDETKINVPKGVVIAIDKQQIYPIEGAVIFGNMDFTLSTSQKKLIDFLCGKKPNVVISDMAPSATGVSSLDSENIIKLCYSVLRFTVHVSENYGTLLVKLWQCEGAKQLENDMAKFYKSVKVVKPNSSRSDSAELYLLGRGFKGLKIS